VALIFNENGVVLGLMLYCIPFVILTLLGPIKNIDPSFEEAAMGLGATELKAFLKITLPLSIPGIISAILLAYTLSISAFAIPIIMGGGKVWVMGNLIYTKFLESPNFPLGAAIAGICLLFALTTTYLFNMYLSRKTITR
jgi:putative spermidine/putrescine transport system permease protein